MALQSDAGRSTGTDQIVSQFLFKALHAILAARIPHIHGAARPPDAASTAPLRRCDRWFHLALGDPPPALDRPDFLPRCVPEPLVVDILLSPRDDPAAPEPVVERWTATCESPLPWSAAAAADSPPNSLHVKRTYKKSIVLLRSIYSLLRLLPAHRLFRMLCASNQSYNYDLSYKASSFAEPFSRQQEAELRQHCFVPVETQYGQLVVSVQYLPNLAEFNLEISSLLPPMLITDYVGSPAADPMRAFPSSPAERGAQLASLPLRGTARPSTSAPSALLFQWPHRWASVPTSHPPLGSSPIPVLHPAPSPEHVRPHRMPSLQSASAPRKASLTFDEFKLSPPFSLSPTPSPPTFTGSYLQSRLHSETAPMSIPQPAGVRIQQHHTPNLLDPTKNLLPPPSPRSTRAGLSAHESPSESSRSFRKSEGLKAGDISSHLHAVQKGLKDGRDDSGRFSCVFSSSSSPRHGFSRSSSRLSIPDDLDDGDFSYPFAVDDVDTSDSCTRSNDGREAAEPVQASTSTRKSQDAAVGTLVHMLRTAHPLRDQSFSSLSLKSELNEGGTSSLFMSRKTSDALEELQRYKELKDILVSQGRAKLQESLKRAE